MSKPLCLTLLVLSLPSLSLRAATIVAQNEPASTVGVYGFSSTPYVPAQTFTPTASGILQQIDVNLTQNGNVPSSMFVDFRPAVGGTPSSLVVATATIAPALTTTPTFFTADFTSSNIPLVAGTTYAYSLRTSNGGAAAQGAYGNLYAGGGAFTSLNSGLTFDATPGADLAFRVLIVPEPATLGLLALGGTIALARRRPR